jgi:peroxiredoxin
MLESPKQKRLDWKLLGVVVFVAAAVTLALLAGFPKREPEIPAPVQGALSDLPVEASVGALPPNFILYDLDGNLVDLAELRGHPILINFWATWCAPCRIEMPAIQSRFEKFEAAGFLVLAVDFDEPQADVEAFRDELGLTFDILLDPGAEIQQLYRTRGYPTTFFVDRDGVIQVHHIGVMTEGQLDGYLQEIGLEQ